MLRFWLKAATIGGLAAVAFLGVGQKPAHASINVQFVSVVANGGGPGIFRWNYTAAVDPGSQADPTGTGNVGPGGVPGITNPGDFFTLYDFLGFTGTGGSSNPDFALQSAPIGATPGFFTTGTATQNDLHFPPVLASDDPTIPNVTFRKTGGGSVIGPAALGTFFVDSTVGFGTLDNYSVGSHNSTAGDVSESAVSAVNRPSISAVPEPGTMALFGLGAVGLFLKLRRRRKTEE